MSSCHKQAYVALGGNFPETPTLFKQALERIQGTLACDCKLRLSALYRTTAVSDIPQADYLNAVCAFVCHLGPQSLLAELQHIEMSLGKIPKAKNAPRPIDLDLLFYGDESVDSEELTLPHPRWQERLFVVRPLMDLTDAIGPIVLSDLVQKLTKASDYKAEICHDI